MEKNTAPKKKNWLREVVDWVIAIGVALVISLVLTQVIFVNAQIPSESMENTIMTGDRVLGLRLAYRTNTPERLDIIIFRYPDNEEELFVKRVIGLPGDVVELQGGMVYINGAGVPLDEPYVNGSPDGRGDGIYVVPEGHYFVLGDNRNNSLDSRFWNSTFVPEDNIIGRAAFRLFPSPGKLE